MAIDFPVEFRTDDLISSYETLQNYRAAYSLLDEQSSDFKFGYIESGIEFYEARIAQIRADLEWFSFIDAETSPKENRDFSTLQPLDRKVMINQHISDREVGYGDSWFACQIPTLQSLYNWYEFMEANH